jgi:NAD(P)-dependent dehydrogenase (short-subunit alcohol dehydrogenase family)
MLKTSKTLPPGSVRIVNVTSGGHLIAPKGGIDFADPSLTKNTPMSRYAQSKLANVLHTKTLHRLYGPGSSSSEGEIWSSALHPGLVQSNIGARAEIPFWMDSLFKVYFAFGGRRMDGDTGAWTSVFCAASPLMTKEQSGTYFERIAKAGTQSSLAKDPMLAQRLEEWTRDMMGKEGFVE